MTNLPDGKPALYGRADLMGLLRYRDRDSFRKKLADLMDHHFFPAPLPGLPNKWSVKEVDAWLAGYRPPQATRQPATSPTSAVLDLNALPRGRASRLQSRLAAQKFVLIQGGLDNRAE